jgi:hypothetical protein
VRRTAAFPSGTRTASDDGVGVVDRREQQALGVRGGRRHHDLESGHVGEPRLEALRVLRRGPGAGPERGPQHHRHAGGAAEHVVDLGGLVDDLVHRLVGEVGELDLHDRTHPGEGRADGGADDAELGDGGVTDPVAAEAVVEVAADAEGAAVDADVLAQHVHAFVALHLLPERLGDRDEVGGLAVVATLASRFRAVARRAGFELHRGRHQPASVPPPRPGSWVQ